MMTYGFSLDQIDALTIDQINFFCETYNKMHGGSEKSEVIKIRPKGAI